MAISTHIYTKCTDHFVTPKIHIIDADSRQLDVMPGQKLALHKLLFCRLELWAGCRISAHHFRCQTAVIADKAAQLHSAHKAADCYWLTDAILLSSSGSCVGSCC